MAWRSTSSATPAGQITDVAVRNVVKGVHGCRTPPSSGCRSWCWRSFCRSSSCAASRCPRGFMGQFEIAFHAQPSRGSHLELHDHLHLLVRFVLPGFSGAFPMLIKTLYGGFDGAPDPLAMPTIGPLLGGLVRMLTGGIFGKIGGSRGVRWTTIGPDRRRPSWSSAATSAHQRRPVQRLPLGRICGSSLMSGINNAATFRQYPSCSPTRPPKAHLQMLWGWTGAWATLRSVRLEFVDPPLRWKKTGAVTAFFIGCAVFYVYSLLVNWWYYTRSGAERFDYGNGGVPGGTSCPEPKEHVKRIDLGQAA